MLKVNNDGQMADFTRAVERLGRGRRQTQREMAGDIVDQFLQARQIA